MSTLAPAYRFFTDLARILNAGQSRSVLLYGNVNDLFYAPAAGNGGQYVPLLSFLCEKCAVPGKIILVYELNGPIRAFASSDREKLKSGWVAWKSGVEAEKLVLESLADRSRLRAREALEAEFDAHLMDAIGKPTLALEFLRQLTICSRTNGPQGRPYLAEDLLVLIEGADLLLPAGSGDIAQLAAVDRRRIAVAQDWFSDPGFMNADDCIVLLAESQSLVHPRVARLPQVLSIEIPAPDQAVREHYIEWFSRSGRAAPKQLPEPKLWSGPAELARFTAGLSVHALRQLLIGASHAGETLQPTDVIGKVEQFITTQLGDDVVEFKKPSHSLDDVVGFSRLKQFLQDEFIPRIRSSGPDALTGAAVAGPIGGGKTFIFEAAATALDMPVLVLKNIRSQWFGQTDVIFERLRRVLLALEKVLIFIDEADTQFGGVGQETHETERRLTGKIQQMMSDPKLRGRVVWLLMTARIHLLSPDIRRPGRAGDLIIPVLDPEGPDRLEFLRWVLKAALGGTTAPSEDDLKRLDQLTVGYSAAAFASLRSHLKSKAADGPLMLDQVEAIVRDHIPPAIEQTRRYQTLQALVNCTRRSLLPDPAVADSVREGWQAELRQLELQGIR